MDELSEIKKYLEMYHSLGIVTIPMKYGDKNPEDKWKRYQYKLPTIKELFSKKWFGNPNKVKNIAIVCGHISDLTVLDFDSAETYNLCMTKELEEKFLIAATHATHRHVYIKTDGTIDGHKDLKHGFEVKSNGAYVVAPPSLHPSGKNYHFQKGFEEVREYLKSECIKGFRITDMIDEFKRKISEHYKSEKEPEKDGKEREFPTGYPCYEGVLKNGAEKGSRDEVGIRLASFLKKRKVKSDSIHEHLVTWNEKNYELVNSEKIPCPLTSKEILDKIKSAGKGYDYSCDKLKELDCFAKYCDKDLCKKNKRLEVKNFNKTIMDLTEKVIIHPGDPTYYEVFLADKVYMKNTDELVKPITFSKWYLDNFKVCFTRISRANWDEIVCKWMNMSVESDKEEVTDNELIKSNILNKLKNFKFIDNISDCLSGDNLFRCNGGVLVYNNIVKDMLNKECKKFSLRITLRDLSVLMKNMLNGVSTVRKVGSTGYRFWQFKPDLFKGDDFNE